MTRFLSENHTLTRLGMKIYQNNLFLGEIAEFMEHPLCRTFYEKYLTRDRIDSTMFFLWLYQQIDKEDSSLDPYKKLAILHHVMHTTELRHIAFDRYHRLSIKKL